MIFNLRHNGNKLQITLKKESSMSLLEQTQQLIGFIDNFKNKIDYSEMMQLISIVLLPMIAKDKEKVMEIHNIIQQAKEKEQQEIDTKFAETSQALLSDIPHTGLELLKSALVELLEEVIRNENNDCHKTIYNSMQRPLLK